MQKKEIINKINSIGDEMECIQAFAGLICDVCWQNKLDADVSRKIIACARQIERAAEEQLASTGDLEFAICALTEKEAVA